MRFLSLSTHQFRNLRDQSLVLNPGFNVLVGQNGQGKTNLLEAIYVLLKGTSFRPAKADSLICHGNGQAFIKGHLQKQDLNYDLICKFQGSQRELKVNQKKLPMTRLSAEFPLVLFSPESLAVIKDGPAARRALIDELLMMHQPEHNKTMRQYLLSLKSRNQVLREYKQGNIPKITTQNLLDSLNQNFFRLATELTVARIKAIQSILPDLNQIFSRIDRSRTVDISVDYVISQKNHLHSTAQQLYDTMSQRAQELLSSEMQSGITLVGPHKHEIQFLIDQNDSRFFCSQGQQRAFILAFKMAQIVYHERLHKQSPILLLDDVMSELDLDKQRFLMEFLQQSSSQIIVTTTDAFLPQRFWGDDGYLFNIRNGSIQTQ